MGASIDLQPLPTNATQLETCLADPIWRIFSGCLYKIKIKGDEYMQGRGGSRKSDAESRLGLANQYSHTQNFDENTRNQKNPNSPNIPDSMTWDDLKDIDPTLAKQLKKYFDEETEIRFRPSFLPFIEPGVEVDVRWKDKWLEMMGAGLVHPRVLWSSGLDAPKWQGFAFGFGLDRIAMLKFGIDDIRYFYNGDLRLINQF